MPFPRFLRYLRATKCDATSGPVPVVLETINDVTGVTATMAVAGTRLGGPFWLQASLLEYSHPTVTCIAGGVFLF